MNARLLALCCAVAALFAWPQPASSVQPEPGTWLDATHPPAWNATVARLPAPDKNGDANPGHCKPTIRHASSPEDRLIAAAGWQLVGAYLRFDGTSIVRAASGFDGMCRWTGYQGFVFVDGKYAGTLSPSRMDSRSDGALDDVSLYSATNIVATFERYKDSDPLCCPSRTSSVQYSLARSSRGATYVVATSVATEANPTGR